MLRETIKYTNYEGNEQTVAAYFHLNQLEATKLQARYGLDIAEYAQKLSAEGNVEKMIAFVEDIILTAYGERTETGGFIKNKEIKEKFSSSEAYAQYFMDLFNDPKRISNFVQGVQPASQSDKPNLGTASITNTTQNAIHENDAVTGWAQ